ncbi:MAG: TonB-dependent receptor [Arachidicoccus sp.]|nr:TonB-dependent receptor [Arachidicoccus sp.]
MIKITFSLFHFFYRQQFIALPRKVVCAWMFFALVLLPAMTFAQNRHLVKGTVTNSKSIALPGVSVTISGQNVGTVTDSAGNYEIQAAPINTLRFSAIGYHIREITVGEKAIIDISLNESDLPSLNDIVVVGYGSQKKVNVTGAISTVDMKQLANRPVQNMAQALEGVAPGLNISQNNGSLESSPTINIRGTGTIGTSSSAPLVLIDGMEASITAINPQDVESISVLKDASASAIYGSRAAFGVILITTKKGSVGKIRVNYNDNFNSSRPVLLPQQMDSYTWALYINAANVNGGSSAFFGADQLQRIQDYQSGKITTSIIPDPNNPSHWGDGYATGNANVNWYKAMYRDQSFSQEHNISVSGGNQNTTYYVSGNYMGKKGLMQFNQDFYDRYGVTAKINTKISDYVSASYSNRYLHESYQRPSALTTTFYQDLARQGWPTLPLYDPNGFLYSSPSPALAMAQGGKDNTQTDWDYQQLQLTIEPLKGWKIYAIGDYRSQIIFHHWDSQQLYNHDVNSVPYLYSTSSNVYEYGYKEDYFNTNFYSEYNKSFNDKHNFKIMGGFQSESTKYRDVSAQRDGIIVPAISTINTTSGTDPNGVAISPAVTGQYQAWATAGFFGRLNYDYMGKYLFEGDIRYDGSSRFRSNDRWILSPSFSVGWNVAKEYFWKKYENILNTFKIRASYGKLGNENTNDWYPTYVTMPVGTANGSWLVNGARPNTANAPGLVSSTLTWESIKSSNLGLDIGMFNNRLTGSFDYFIRKTLNMVGPAPKLPAILGTAVPQTNNTNLKTYGFEAQIAWGDHLKNGLSYNFGLQLSDNQTIVTKYPNPDEFLTTYLQGRKLGEIWGYTTIGIAKTQAEMDTHLATLDGGQNSLGSKWAAGDIMYKDYNKDGKLNTGDGTVKNPGDMHVIGNNTPRYMFGFTANASWKGFDINMFLQGVMKRDYWQGSPFFWGVTGSGQWWADGFVQHENYFRNDPDDPLGENLNAYYPRPLFDNKNEQVQTRYLQNAAYIRLKNLQIGYTLPVSLVKKWSIESVRFYISGENLWTGTKMAKMFDPETVDGGSGGDVYPLQKVFSGGLSVTF